MRFASRRSPSQNQMPKIGLCTIGVPVYNANRIRLIEESTVSRWPSSLSGPSEWRSPQGTPLSTANGIRLMGVPPCPGGSLLQVNEIHLKGLPLSIANGIRFRGVPFSKENGIRLLGFPPIQGGSLLQVNEIHLKELPLSTANGIRFRGVPFSKENGILLKGIPSPQRMGFASKDSPPQQRMGFASIASPSLSEWYSHQEGHPLDNKWVSHQRVTLSKRMGLASRGSPSPKRMGFASNVGPSCRKRPLSRDSSPRPRYSRDSLFQRVSPLRLSEWYSLQEILILPNDSAWVGGLWFSSTTHSFRASSREPLRSDLPPFQTVFWREGRFALPEEVFRKPPQWGGYRN